MVYEWPRHGLGVSRNGLGIVWEWSRVGFGMVWEWSKNCAGVVLELYRIGLGMAQEELSRNCVGVV